MLAVGCFTLYSFYVEDEKKNKIVNIIIIIYFELICYMPFNILFSSKKYNGFLKYYINFYLLHLFILYSDDKYWHLAYLIMSFTLILIKGLYANFN